MDSVFDKYGKAQEDGRFILDLNLLGYDKLLGGGKPSRAFIVKVAKVSNTAKEKIESAGGEVLSNEYNRE